MCRMIVNRQFCTGLLDAAPKCRFSTILTTYGLMDDAHNVFGHYTLFAVVNPNLDL